MNHYSQWGEDEFLAHFFEGKTDGFFVDIGANNGITGSNTRALWERGWSGVMVEGCYQTFLALLNNYRDAERIRFVYGAICKKQGVVEFYEDRKLPSCGWNSMNADWINLFPKDQFSVTLAPAMTIAQLGLPDRFDFLSVDTEGNDFVVLQGMPPSMRPRLIMAEIDKFDNRRLIDELLKSRNYEQVWMEPKSNSNVAYAAR